MPRALTVAGSDPGGGAGIQADLKTFTVLGAFGTSVLTAVTAQNTLGVSGVYPLSPAQVEAQLDAVLADLGTDAVKTGMLVDAPIIQVVADRLRHYGAGNLVIDPVLVAKGGRRLLEPAAEHMLITELLPLAAVITPNLPEAEVLAGLSVRNRADMVTAARRLVELGARAVVVKGGHLEGEPADDLLYTGGEAEWLHAVRAPTTHTHGTGCTFSAAICAGLAGGMSLRAAVRQAKDFITLAIQRAPGLGAGHGPTNHLAWLEQGRPAQVRSGLPLAGRLALYVIVSGSTPPAVVQNILAAGAGTIQFREKSLPLPAQVEAAKRLRALCHAAGALFLVNDRVDLALATGADGVHLGQEDLPVGEARRLLGPGAVIGATCETAAEAAHATAAGADYIGTGPVYATPSKADAGAPYGPAVVSRVVAATPLPVVGIGGIGPGGAAPVIQAGACGVAVISAVVGAPDPGAAARAIRQEVAAAYASRRP